MAFGAWLAWERATGASSASSPSASIAVLPFDDVSADEGSRHFAGGVTEDVLTNLARIEDLRVIARTSVLRYQGSDRPLDEIARELGVGYVLEGSVRRAGERVRINVQLVDVRAKDHVWARSYDRRLEDLFTVQSEIARAIAGELEAELTPAVEEQIGRARTVVPGAYEAYVRGLYHFRQGGPLGYGDSASVERLRTATRFYRQAIDADPGWAEPRARLASVYHWLASGGVEPAR